MRATRVALCTLALVLFASAVAAPPAPPAPIPEALTPADGLLCAGQPSEKDIAAVSAAGYKTVINLRTETERGFAWEPDAVKSAGMDYVVIPVAGASGLTKENAARLDAALKQAAPKGPVLVHCASGNRVGALLALRAAWIEGTDPATALAFGKSAGLAGLEPQVKELLGLR